MYGNRNTSNGFAGMAPEDAFAMGIKRGLDLIKELGRGGDSELAHVNPQEAEMLRQAGGSGTINPQSGLREYLGGRAGGVGKEGVGGGFDGPGREDGGSQRDDRPTGRPGAVGKPGVGGGFDGTRGGGVSSNPSSAGGTSGPVGDATGGENATGGGRAGGVGHPDAGGGFTDNRDWGQRIADGLDAAFGGWGWGEPNKTSPGALGSVIEAVVPGFSVPMMGTRFAQAAGIPNREKQPGELGTDEYSGQRDGDILSPGRNRPQQQVPKAPPASQYAWTRPSALPSTPMALGFDGGMTPLQMRTNIATGATNADAGIYRDPQILNFYRNLALYDLTQPGGAPIANANVTDIERQFLTHLGKQPGDTTETFLRALSGL